MIEERALVWKRLGDTGVQLKDLSARSETDHSCSPRFPSTRKLAANARAACVQRAYERTLRVGFRHERCLIVGVLGQFQAVFRRELAGGEWQYVGIGSLEIGCGKLVMRFDRGGMSCKPCPLELHFAAILIIEEIPRRDFRFVRH